MNADIKIIEIKPSFSEKKFSTPLKFRAVVVEAITYAEVRVNSS